MENQPPSDFYQEIENALNSSKDEVEKKSIQTDYLKRFLEVTKNIPSGPISLSELLSRPPVLDEDELDELGRGILLLLPNEVVAITYPNNQEVSRESDLPEDKKLRWTLRGIDEYRIGLLKDLGKDEKSII